MSKGSNSEIEVQSFDKPTEVREFEGLGRLDVIDFTSGPPVARGTFEPGWRWSVNVQPIAGTKSCQFEHLTYIEQGTMEITMDSGQQVTLSSGSITRIPAGHDARVIGNEPCIAIDFASKVAESYAARR